MNAERIVLSIDTSNLHTARELVALANENGGKVVKFGLEFATAYSWKQCVEIAKEQAIDWIADAKLDDIPHTIEMAVKNICQLDPQPIGITVHIKAGDETLRLAQIAADETIVFGVTELTAIPETETFEKYALQRDEFVSKLLYFAKRAGIKGVVVSGHEIKNAKANGLLTLVPGIRSHSASKDDQSNTIDPLTAIKRGANYIVVGRQITQADNPPEAYKKLLQEVVDSPKV